MNPMPGYMAWCLAGLLLCAALLLLRRPVARLLQLSSSWARPPRRRVGFRTDCAILWTSFDRLFGLLYHYSMDSLDKYSSG